MRLTMIEAGEIVSTHGVKGEVKVLPWTDGPDFLLDYKRIKIAGNNYDIENCRIQKNCTLVKIKGIDSIEQAQELRGKIVEVYREDIQNDIIFAAELLGVKVISNDVELGTIVDVLDYPGNKVYIVAGEYSYMIPAVKEFVLSTDIDANVMYVRIIEGMRIDES